MNRERFGLGIAANKGKFEQSLDNQVQFEWIGGDMLEKWPEIRSACGNKFLGNGIRGQESKNLEQFNSDRVALAKLLEGNGPGRGDGFRMIQRKFSPPFQKHLAPGLIEIDVIRQATFCFFDIGSCLVEREWQALEVLPNRALPAAANPRRVVLVWV